MAEQNSAETWHRADQETGRNQPPGVRLVRTLRGHTGWIGRIAWSPDGRILASPSQDRTIRLWDTETGECLRTLEGHRDQVRDVAFDSAGGTLASASHDKTVKLWEATSGRLLRTLEEHEGAVGSVAFESASRTLASASTDRTTKLWEAASGQLLLSLEGHRDQVNSVAFQPLRHILASGSYDKTVKLWDAGSGRLLRTLEGHHETVLCVAFDSVGRTLTSGSNDKTVKLWEVDSGRLLRTLEGHTDWVQSVAFNSDGRLVASKGRDDTVRLWSCRTGVCLGIIREPVSGSWAPGLAFHPRLNLLATVGSDPGTRKDENDRLIHIWELEPVALFGRLPTIPSSHYVNAKAVLLGDTGVGKTGLGLVLNGKPFEATDSTPGRRVWTLESEEVELESHLKQTRETLLWDLAGQPGYRVIHQLHLNEVAVALVVFDARSDTDPLAGVRHWERALRLAQQRQGSAAVPMKKFLVSARADRGTVSVSKERLEALRTEFRFDDYFETSSKEGWKIEELRQAIKESIPWGTLPEVSSSVLFTDIKAYLLEAKTTGRLVAPVSELYHDFSTANPEIVAREPDLPEQFNTCIGRLENRDLIRLLSFGGYVLLQPELLDAYASAIVNAAKREPDGLGSMAEDVALAGQFYVPDEQRIKNRAQEQLLLHATVEELARHDLALRESATDGRYLVFPSEFIRDYEAAPEPKGSALAITFDGPVQGLYSTLAVRLGHSGLFTTGRTEMWRNAAVFTAQAGGKCGLYLYEFTEARGKLVIFYDQFEGRIPSDETRFNFEEFVVAHAKRRALEGTVVPVRIVVCASCGNPVPDSYIELLRQRSLTTFDCPCGGRVSLTDPKERLHYPSKVTAMEQSADRQRNLEVFVQSARGETSTPSFMEWAGDERATLAIVFTDVVGSTALGDELKDERMSEVRRAHFAQSRKLINQFKGREIKTMGDSFMAAFRSVDNALDYALALQVSTGHSRVRIRAGIHIGSMQVENHDVFGGAVNFAARVVGAIKGAEIWLSDQAKRDLTASGAKQHAHLKWQPHGRVKMKGFPGVTTLWSLRP